MKDIVVNIKFGDRTVAIATEVPKKYRNKKFCKYMEKSLKEFYRSVKVAYKAYGYIIKEVCKGE